MKEELLKKLHDRKKNIEKLIAEVEAMRTSPTKEQAACMAQHAGECGTCSGSGGWTPCG